MEVNRRVLIGAAASLILAPRPASASTNSQKAKFMQAAIQDIEREKDVGRDENKAIPEVCKPIPFFGMEDFWYTEGALRWVPNPGQTLPTVTVPSGFCTDLTSVPQLFWWLVANTGRHAYAAIVHDFLYWTQSGSREDADNVLFTALQDLEVPTWKVWTIYRMVRWFGESSWTSNATAKKGGEKRFLTFPFPPSNASWAEWKRDLSHFSD